MLKKSPRKRRKLWLILLIVSVLILIAGVVVYNRIVNIQVHLKTGTQYFYIKSTDGYEDVLANLTREGIVTETELFDMLAERANLTNKTYPGRYTLRQGQTYLELIRQLRSGKQDEIKLVINPMITARQLSSLVGQHLEADSIILINMLEDSTYLKKLGFTKENILCLIIPNTYNFYWNTSAETFMKRMKKEYDRFWNDNRKTKAAAQGLTPVEAGILASIVDAETNKVDEMGIIAGLYLNRLKKGMLLQADPTVRYIFRAQGLKRVLEYHTKAESPYNTYLHTGLPPGPLALPSQQAIEAVLHPSQHNYIYMCAKEDLSGYHNFTDNLAQHNLNAARYRLELDKLGIK